MNIKTVKRIIISAVIAIIAFICLIAMMCPPQSIARFVPQNDAVAEYLPGRVVSAYDAYVSPEGRVNITGANPNIYIGDINENITTVAIKFKEPIHESFSGVMYYDTGKGLNEGEKVYSAAFEGDEWVCFVLPEQSLCRNARIDIDLEYTFESVNVYAEKPATVLVDIENPWWEYLVCAGISLLVFAAVFVLDIKFRIIDSVFKCLSQNKKSILKVSVVAIATIVLSIALELMCGLIFGAMSTGALFNIYRYLFICATLLSVAAIVMYARSTSKKIEILFLCLVLIFGTVMIFASPYGHIAWDVENHYNWALDASYLGDAYRTEADRYIVKNNDLYWAKKDAAENAENIKLLNGMYGPAIEEFTTTKMISHLPSGVAIALLRFFKTDFYWIYTLGRLPNLLIYALLCYFAMKKLKSGKMILAVIALLPTNLFIATNYSYDYWVTALSLLGMAYFVSEMQQPEKPISLRENIIMCGALALASVPKQIYALMLFIPFLMRKKEFKNRKRYYAICVAAFLFVLFLLAVRSLSSVTSAGDLRGGSAVNPRQQIGFILGNPFTYAKTLLKFLWTYLSLGAAENYICNMAYLGYGYGHYTMMILLLGTAFTDKNEYDFNNKYLLLKGFNLLFLFGMAALMATALYISFTAVGSDIIAGCQGRYLMPVIFPVLSIIGNNMFTNNMNRTVYNLMIIIPSTVVVLSTVASTMITRLM